MDFTDLWLRLVRYCPPSNPAIYSTVFGCLCQLYTVFHIQLSAYFLFYWLLLPQTAACRCQQVILHYRSICVLLFLFLLFCFCYSTFFSFFLTLLFYTFTIYLLNTMSLFYFQFTWSFKICHAMLRTSIFQY